MSHRSSAVSAVAKRRRRPARRAEAAAPAHPVRRFLRRRDQAFALRPLARELAHAAHRLGLLPRRFLRWLLVEPPALHLAEDAFALHLLFQHAERLVDVVVAHQDLQWLFLSWSAAPCLYSRRIATQ